MVTRAVLPRYLIKSCWNRRGRSNWTTRGGAGGVQGGFGQDLVGGLERPEERKYVRHYEHDGEARQDEVEDGHLAEYGSSAAAGARFLAAAPAGGDGVMAIVVMTSSRRWCGS